MYKNELSKRKTKQESVYKTDAIVSRMSQSEPKNWHECTELLYIAIVNDEFNFMEYLIEANKLDGTARLFGYKSLEGGRDYLGATMLHLAAYSGSVKCTTHLLRNYPSLRDCKDDGDQTPLDRAQGDSIRALFVDAGAASQGPQMAGQNCTMPGPQMAGATPIGRTVSAGQRQSLMEVADADLSRSEYYTRAPMDPAEKLQIAAERMGGIERMLRERVREMYEVSSAPEKVREEFRANDEKLGKRSLRNKIDNFLAWQQEKLLDAVTAEDLKDERKRLNRIADRINNFIRDLPNEPP